MPIESLLGILGFAIGCLSLGIHFLIYKMYAPKVIIKKAPNSFWFNFKDLPSDVRKSYFSEKGAIISVKISNCSSFPITIDEATIFSSDKSKHNEGFNFPETKIQIDEVTHSFISPYKKARLPLRIDSYDTVLVSFSFPFFEKHIHKVKLVLETPRKNYSLKVDLLEYFETYDLLHPHRPRC